MLKFPQDRLATFTCSFGLTDRSVFEVIGTNGVLKMDPAYEMAEALKSEITLGERKQRKTFPKRDQFAAELEYFSGCVLNDKEPEPSGQDGLADVRIIQALLKSAEDNRPVSVKPAMVTRRPGMKQAIAKPPVATSGTCRCAKGGKVKSKKQAVVIGLSEARKKGAKVPKKKESS